VLPIKERKQGLGKWAPNWEGPFQIHRVLKRGAYHLKDLNGYVHRRKINGRYLKAYVPTIWESFSRR